MIIPINWLNYYVAIYRYMKMTYHNHDMENYIDYHDIRYILHITTYIYNGIVLMVRVENSPEISLPIITSPFGQIWFGRSNRSENV